MIHARVHDWRFHTGLTKIFFAKSFVLASGFDPAAMTG